MGRDIFNEKTGKDETNAKEFQLAENLPNKGIIYTSLGEIHFILHPQECPKTVENFVTHSKNGYFNGVIFHRVIKSFMVQTGDPDGDGTGGTSIWGEEFEDEFNENLTHNEPFVLSMANCGKNTNGS